MKAMIEWLIIVCVAMTAGASLWQQATAVPEIPVVAPVQPSEYLTPTPTPGAPSVAVDAESTTSISEADRDMLARIAMAEAEGEGLVGKALVVRVVMNRVESPAWPNTVEDVIMQPKQFSPVWNGRYERVKPDAECYEAVDMVAAGWDESQGAMYFRQHTEESCWHNDCLTLLFRYGGHDFFE